jgi:hypothetical protein
MNTLSTNAAVQLDTGQAQVQQAARGVAGAWEIRDNAGFSREPT